MSLQYEPASEPLHILRSSCSRIEDCTELDFHALTLMCQHLHVQEDDEDETFSRTGSQESGPRRLILTTDALSC